MPRAPGKHWKGAAFASATILAAFGCNAVLGIQEYPADVGDSGAGDSFSPQDGTLGSDGATTLEAGTDAGNGTPDGQPDAASDACNPATQPIYLVDSTNSISAFDVQSKVVTPLGPLDCSTTGVLNALAVDETRVATLEYVSVLPDAGQAGALYQFDLKLGHGCHQLMNLPATFAQSGLAFVAPPDGGTAETLFLSGSTANSGVLGKLPPGTTTIVTVGSYSGDPSLTIANGGPTTFFDAITGTDDGRLFGLFATTPSMRLVEITASNAAVASDVTLPGLPSGPTAWAISQWQGDFYTFVAPAGGKTSVGQYVSSNASFNPNFAPNTGLTIVGSSRVNCPPPL